MFPPYKPYIPKGVSQIMDYLGMMMLDSPTFVDRTGYLPGRNLEITFSELNEGLRLIRGKLGEERYLSLWKCRTGCERILKPIRRTRRTTPSKVETLSSRWRTC